MAGRAAPAAPVTEGTWTTGCEQAKATGAYGFAQVRTAYGIDALGPGDGASVAILTAGEGIPARDIADAARCFDLPALRTRTMLGDGQARPFGRGTFEPQEDLALVRGMSPGLGSATFAQVWLAPELWFLGAAEVLAKKSPPGAFSISYGECERDVRGRRAGRASRAGADLLDALLVHLGLVGVSAFASAGDFGTVPGSRRAVPDVSAHASMPPGWPVVLAGSWVEDAGTSASAPLVAGAFAA